MKSQDPQPEKFDLARVCTIYFIFSAPLFFTYNKYLGKLYSRICLNMPNVICIDRLNHLPEQFCENNSNKERCSITIRECKISGLKNLLL